MSNQMPVFVYGTLRNPNGVNPQGNYRWALAGRTVSEQPATLDRAVMYDNNGGFPFVSRTDATDHDQVQGEVMYLDPTQYDAVVRDLDGLEGYRGPNARGNMYERVLVTVTTADGQQIEAYTYLTAPDLFEHRVKHLPVVTNGDWVGYKENMGHRLLAADF